MANEAMIDHGEACETAGRDDFLQQPVSKVDVIQEGLFDFTPEQIKLIPEKPDIEFIEILTTGNVYLPGIYYTNAFDRVFGPGGHSMKVLRRFFNQATSAYYVEAQLVSRIGVGQPVIGAMKYHQKVNLPSDCLSGALTEARRRAGKQLGFFWYMHRPDFIQKFIDEKCELVEASPFWSPGKKEEIWVRKDRGIVYPYVPYNGPEKKQKSAPPVRTAPRPNVSINEGGGVETAKPLDDLEKWMRFVKRHLERAQGLDPKLIYNVQNKLKESFPTMKFTGIPNLGKGKPREIFMEYVRQLYKENSIEM